MTAQHSLQQTKMDTLLARLRSGQEEFTRRYPGEGTARQPMQTVYGGAQLFRSDTASKLGMLALRGLEEYAPDSGTLASAINLHGDGEFAQTIYERVRSKLEREPVEDFRIDFEDGYGARGDAEEDACAGQAAEEVAKGISEGTLPPFIGIRIKPLNAEFSYRGLRTLDIFLTTLLQRSGGVLPANFVVTIPKVVDPSHVEVLVQAFESIELANGIQPGTLQLELMVETTQSILGPEGRCVLADLVAAAKGRCRGAHFGVYDYTAGCSITAEFQEMSHPCCDFARHMMQVQLSGTGVWLSDGATNILPVGPHAAARGESLSVEQREANAAAVHRAWRLHADDVRRSLRHGFYQGWDLHPAQLTTRYAACYEFFLSGLDSAANRLRNFVEKAAQATLAGDVFDDAATGQGLLNYFLRGISSGAISEQEAAATGLTLEELRLRSFAKILAVRSGKS